MLRLTLPLYHGLITVVVISRSIKLRSHYTFDYAQQYLYPYSYRQVGPIYFKTPRKVQSFGASNEGASKQVNFLADEDQTIGEDGSLSHGANAVLRQLDYYWDTYSYGEEKMTILRDNCCGQNKNKTTCAHLCWRVIMGLNDEIEYYQPPPGHTRNFCGGGFGAAKQLYRRFDINCLLQLAEVSVYLYIVMSVYNIQNRILLKLKLL